MSVGECLDQVDWCGKPHLNLGRDILNADAGTKRRVELSTNIDCLKTNYLCECACVCCGTRAELKELQSQFFPCSFMWVPGLEFT